MVALLIFGFRFAKIHCPQCIALTKPPRDKTLREQLGLSDRKANSLPPAIEISQRRERNWPSLGNRRKNTHPTELLYHGHLKQKNPNSTVVCYTHLPHSRPRRFESCLAKCQISTMQIRRHLQGSPTSPHQWSVPRDS